MSCHRPSIPEDKRAAENPCAAPLRPNGLYAARAFVFNGGMTQDQPMFNVRQFAAAASITVPEARLPALAAGLATTLATMEWLLALDYGDAEPASRFRPPPQ